MALYAVTSSLDVWTQYQAGGADDPGDHIAVSNDDYDGDGIPEVFITADGQIRQVSVALFGSGGGAVFSDTMHVYTPGETGTGFPGGLAFVDINGEDTTRSVQETSTRIHRE
jgi:hypothetical protein